MTEPMQSIPSMQQGLDIPTALKTVPLIVTPNTLSHFHPLENKPRRLTSLSHFQLGLPSFDGQADGGIQRIIM